MSCITFKMPDGTSGILSLGGSNHIIEVNGERHRFEDHPYFGPAFVNRRGDPLRNQPGSRHPVWTAVQRWYDQGKQTDPSNGMCMWSHKPKDILKHMGGRHYLHVGVEPAELPASLHPALSSPEEG